MFLEVKIIDTDNDEFNFLIGRIYPVLSACFNVEGKFVFEIPVCKLNGDNVIIALENVEIRRRDEE